MTTGFELKTYCVGRKPHYQLSHTPTALFKLTCAQWPKTLLLPTKVVLIV